MRRIRQQRQGACYDTADRLDDHAAAGEQQCPKQLRLAARWPVRMAVMAFVVRMIVAVIVAGCMVMVMVMVMVVVTCHHRLHKISCIDGPTV
jgi:sterol desaturase/sphingolipid hydroxylase (fatty acid hydroxylase superfamily)